MKVAKYLVDVIKKINKKIMIKRCFSCNRLKPLIWFKINPRKYQLKTDRGKSVNCRLCNVKRLIRQGEVIKHNPLTNKYDTVKMKINLLNLLKYYFI
jgi:hypothetical protein